MKLPRLYGWIIASIALLAFIGLFFPQQLPVSLYKLSLVSMAGVVGYWRDRSLFPYARPDSYLACAPRERYQRTERTGHDADYRVNSDYALIFAVSMLRRALIVSGAMLAIGLGA